MEKLYTPQEIADQLKIKKHTVYDLLKGENCNPLRLVNSLESLQVN